MKHLLVSFLLPVLLVSCNGSDGPDGEVLKKVYSNKVIFNNTINVAKLDITKEEPLKNKMADSPENKTLRYDVDVVLKAKEDCKLSIEDVYESYSPMGIPSGDKTSVYQCVSSAERAKVLADIKTRLDGKVGKKDYDSCGNSMNCRPALFTKASIEKKYEEEKSKYEARFTKDLKKDEVILEQKQQIVVKSHDKRLKPNWNVTKVRSI